VSNVTKTVLIGSGEVLAVVAALLIGRFLGSIGIVFISVPIVIGLELCVWPTPETPESSVGQNMKAGLILLGCVMPAVVFALYLILPNEVEDWLGSEGITWFGMLYLVLLVLLVIGSWIHRIKA